MTKAQRATEARVMAVQCKLAMQKVHDFFVKEFGVDHPSTQTIDKRYTETVKTARDLRAIETSYYK